MLSWPELIRSKGGDLFRFSPGDLQLGDKLRGYGLALQLEKQVYNDRTMKHKLETRYLVVREWERESKSA